MILFADDILLLAPTRNALQKMIHLCAAYCKEFGLTFNASKSKIVVFSKSHIDNGNLSPILLNGRKIDNGCVSTQSHNHVFHVGFTIRDFTTLIPKKYRTYAGFKPTFNFWGYH